MRLPSIAGYMGATNKAMACASLLLQVLVSGADRTILPPATSNMYPPRTCLQAEMARGDVVSVNCLMLCEESIVGNIWYEY